MEAFSTPIPFTHAGRSELLVVGGDCLTGHDLDTGKELWPLGHMEPFKIPTGAWSCLRWAAAGWCSLAHRKARQFTRSRRGPRDLHRLSRVGVGEQGAGSLLGCLDAVILQQSFFHS